MKEIARGAEAVIYDDGNAIVKERIAKAYRVKEVDEDIRLHRTKREARVLQKIEGKVNAPKVLLVEKTILRIEKLSGELMRDFLDKAKDKEAAAACKAFGFEVAKLHSLGIAHGDLTTSNALWDGSRLSLIDFGLSFHSLKDEDKAVDLHLVEEALESRHCDNWELLWKSFLEGYVKENTSQAKRVLTRLEAVRGRGRYKKKQAWG